MRTFLPLIYCYYLTIFIVSNIYKKVTVIWYFPVSKRYYLKVSKSWIYITSALWFISLDE